MDDGIDDKIDRVLSSALFLACLDLAEANFLDPEELYAEYCHWAQQFVGQQNGTYMISKDNMERLSDFRTKVEHGSVG